MKVNNPTKLKFPLIITNKNEKEKYKKLLELKGYKIGYITSNGVGNNIPYELTIALGKTLLRNNLQNNE